MADERIDWLVKNPTVIMAARIARMFRMDPVEVLNDRGDEFILHVRVAALKIAAHDEEEANKK